MEGQQNIQYSGVSDIYDDELKVRPIVKPVFF
jgi:hypothetical protein